MPRSLPRLLLACLLVLATAVSSPANPLKSKTKTTDDAADSATRKLPEYTGVKHALGVLDFENQASYQSQYTLGQNLRMMLESALFDSGRFVIVERDELNAVMSEQNLQGSGRAAASTTVAQTGKLRSARYLASGAITEVSDGTSGQSGGVSIRGIRIGGSGGKSSLVLVVKLIDTTSGQVVASQRVRGEAGKRGVNLGFYRDGIGGDLGAFAKTPLAEAAQDCIDQAVAWIATEMGDYKIEGSVVTVANDQVVISLGENFGVKTGQRFAVRKDGEVLLDPATGEILDKLEGETTGHLEAVRVREKVTYCKLLDGTLPTRGDLVIVE